MAVAHQHGLWRAVAISPCKCGRHGLPCVCQRGTPRGLSDRLRVIEKRFVCLGQSVHDFATAERILRKLIRQLQEHAQIQKKVEHILVLDAQRKRFSRENEIVLRALLERLFANNIMPGVKFYGELQFLPGPGVLTHAVAVMVAVARYNDLRGECAAWRAVHPQHGLITAKLRAQKQIAPGQRVQHGAGRTEPAIASFSTPDTALRTLHGVLEQRGLRDVREAFGCLIHGKRQCAYLGEDIRFICFERAGKLDEQFFVLRGIQHNGRTSQMKIN